MRFYLLPVGRLSRFSYWFLVAVPLYLIAYLDTVLVNDFGVPKHAMLITVVVVCFILVAGARRLHDLNLSGWRVLLYFAPAAVIGAARRMDLMPYGTIAKNLGMIGLGLIPGTRGDNRYGSVYDSFTAFCNYVRNAR